MMLSSAIPPHRMLRKRVPPGRAGGFTLIELLVVVASIGVLVVLLLPVASRVRKSVDAAKCFSNLKQIGAMFHLYVAEHDGNMPAYQLDHSTKKNWHDAFENNGYTEAKWG